jgi:ABC-type lipoprotein release transport system permease subunit
MNALLDTTWVVTQMAMRNLLASRWKTLIVGGIIGLGACLVVVGTSLLDGVDRAIRRSITGSVAGHIQVYSSESTDPLEVLGSMNGDAPNIAPLPDFAVLKAVVSSVPNVAAIVPMGINSAVVTSGNTIDQALSRLRVTVTQRRAANSPELARAYEMQKAHVQQIVKVLGGDVEHMQRLEASHTASAEDGATLDKARSPAFWGSFDDDPFGHLEFLENKAASLASDAEFLYLRYVGTDPQGFEHAFDRMKIVDGQSIPVGKRGFLFSKYIYEEQIKLKAARGLDKIKRARDARGLTIAKDPDLQRLVRENSGAVRDVVLQLDAAKTADFRAKLQGVLASRDGDVAKLLAAFFDTDDENFDERYRFFYAQLAPALELYRIRIGDDLMIRAVSRGGYQYSANLKVYGTYAFTGLEKSPQAGSLNMMDLVSFRELYGFMTPEREREVAALRVAAGATDVERDRVEAQLFGAESLAGADALDTHPNNGALHGLDLLHSTHESRAGSSYDPLELQRGIVLNAAVLLRDETKLAETMKSIERAGKRANLPLKVISWQTAAGLLGQFATLMRAVLYGAVFIIFVVALVIINNSLVMATLERVREIGTLRAIGAQRKLILAILLLESVVVGLIAGGAGALVGATALSVLGVVGIPASTDLSSFVFSGPRLYPQVGAGQLGIALATVLIVTVLSGFYPAWLAMRISPREAMQSEE